jgi:nitroreductase
MNYKPFTKALPELIKSRRSCRNFALKAIEPEKLEQIQDALDNYGDTPFGSRQRFLTLQESGNLLGRVPGTYGVIKGAQYLIVAFENAKDFMPEDLGFALEKIILRLTELDLGSCWMGGTFQKKHFQNQITLSDGEKIAIVLPFGYAAEKSSLIDQIFRKTAGSDHRKSLGEIIFDGKADIPLDEHKLDERMLSILECVRLAPSASNRQPWRLVLSNSGVDFYLQRTPNYRKAFLTDLQRVDMGIAMAHFEMACDYYNLSGKWNLEKIQDEVPESYEYILTWKWLSR